MESTEARRLRRKLGLSQVELAGRVGVHPMTVSRWERGVVTIPGPTAQLLRLLVKMSIPEKTKK